MPDVFAMTSAETVTLPRRGIAKRRWLNAAYLM
jgi:hypothetical protein